MKLGKKILSIIFTAITTFTFAQNVGDTIVVQSFNYNQTTGIGNRDTIIDFPELQGVTFEKVLMLYNMRCKGGVLGGCGEWDYSCNTYIHDSTRVDSLLSTTPSHVIGGFTGTTFNFTSQPTYSIYQTNEQSVVVNAINSETVSTVGGTGVGLTNIFATDKKSGKSQYLYTASELLTAGLIGGNIDGIQLQILSGAETADFVKVKIKHTNLSELDAISPELTGWTEVYYSSTDFVSGLQNFQFYQPFLWDGTSNIIIEFSFHNDDFGGTIEFAGENTGSNLGLTSAGDFHQFFTGSNYIESDSYKGVGGTTARTVEAWIKSTDTNGEIAAWGTNETGSKWVFRLENNGRIRVEVNAGYVVGTTVVNDNEWHHVACTFNGTDAADIKLYVDGNLETNSSVGPLAISTNIENGINFRSSRGVNERYFDGIIDEMRVWNINLSVNEMRDWMYRPVDASHPKYANLDLYHPLNETSGQIVNDQSGNGNHGKVIKGAVWSTIKGEDLFKDFKVVTTRPSINFLQGNYDLTITPTIVNDTVFNAPNPVTEYQIVSNPGTIFSDEISPVSQMDYWEATSNFIYDPLGSLIQTIPVTAEGTINITDLNYFQRWPMKFEIMSFVTPYGNGLNLGPNGKTWTFDLTDFTPILKGSKRMTMERGGQWQEDMDIKFLFIVGTPIREVKDIRQIWRTESRSYTDIMSNKYFSPRDYTLDATGKSFKIRTAITGHGQEGEFIPRQHFVNINGGGQEFVWNVWKECAENPVYPQGGTWIYDRAGWCPGMATDVQHFDITNYVTAGSPVNIDYGVSTASGTSNYIVSNQLVTYGAPNHTLDAAIVEVSQPTDRVEFQRFNSICNTPKVRIQNTGLTTLTSLTISYWINGATNHEQFVWTGSLEVGETEEVELPATPTLWEPTAATDNVFYAEVSLPNGSVDEYLYNNKYTSKFTIPEVMPSKLIIWFKTNNAGHESSYQLLDVDGNIVKQRSGMSSNTLYKDTVELGIGCYTYKVMDSGDDGLSFFANSDGNGYTRFYKVGGGSVKNFEDDFGDGFEFNFTVDFPLSYEEINNVQGFKAYPNPTSDELNISLVGFEKNVKIEVYGAVGSLVYSQDITADNELYSGKISLRGLENGTYIIRAIDGQNTSQQTIVKY